MSLSGLFSFGFPGGTWSSTWGYVHEQYRGMRKNAPAVPACPGLYWRGMNPYHLRTLGKTLLTAETLDVPVTDSGLFNARPQANKTFILGDFLMSRELGFLCITETVRWTGESTPIKELLPVLLLFQFPAVVRSKRTGNTSCFAFKCRHICPRSSFGSFKLCSFELGGSHVDLCAALYRPPKYNKDLSNFG